ncbi:MAG: TolC family protein [Polyangiaceae bacterium]|nr:TolC family protein [Polyangiaceae bacterium]
MLGRRLGLPLAQLLIGCSTMIAVHAARAQEAGDEVAPPARPVVAPSSGKALPPLADFVAAGRAKAPASEEADAVLELREVEKEQTILSVLPTFTATASYTRNQHEAVVEIPTSATTSERVVVSPHDQLDAVLRLDITLLDMRAFYRIGAADARLEAAALTASSTKRDVERAVTVAYWQRVGAEAVERSAINAVSVAEENRKVVVARVEANVGSDLDVERATASVDRAKQLLAEAVLARSIAARKLKSLTGLDASGTAPPLTADVAAAPPLSTYDGKEAGVPLVRASALEIRAAEIAETASWMTLVPRIFGTVQERFSNATGFSGEVAVWSVGVTAEWRVDPALIGAARVEGASRRVTEARHVRITQDAKDAIEDAWLEVQMRREAAVAARSEQAAADKAASVARTQYLANKASQIDVIVADRDAVQAEVRRIEADANLELARANLRLATTPAEEP